MNIFLPMYETLIKLFFIIEYYYGIKGITAWKIIIIYKNKLIYKIIIMIII